MRKKDLKVKQFKQIKPYSCVPAGLQQLLDYYGLNILQEDILDFLDIPERGMSIPCAGQYIKEKGFKPFIISNNINIFDPAWFKLSKARLISNLAKRKKHIDIISQSVIDDYTKYLLAGGRLGFATIGLSMIKQYLTNGCPVMVELASTFLYKKSRSTMPGKFNDPFKGAIEGHCVVIAGFDDACRFKIIDPDSDNNPFSKKGVYWISGEDLLVSIFISEGKSLLVIESPE